MKALILAAGMGTRLTPLTNEIPKCLVKVNGKPIIFKQIENLMENGIEEIYIVAGYKYEKLEESVSKLFPNVKIIYNYDYSITNNMYSAYIGLKLIGKTPFIMMNGDVFFDSSVIKSLLDFKSEDAIVTDIGNYHEESMKVIEFEGKLNKISKIISKNEALGSSIDVYKFSSETNEVFYLKCKEFIEEKHELKLWSEVALNEILPLVNFKACPLNGRWFEIDNLDDLKQAESLFSNVKKIV